MNPEVSLECSIESFIVDVQAVEAGDHALAYHCARRSTERETAELKGEEGDTAKVTCSLIRTDRTPVGRLEHS